MRRSLSFERGPRFIDRGLQRQDAGGFDLNIAGGFGKEDKAHVSGTSRACRVNLFMRCQAADLDPHSARRVRALQKDSH